MLESQEPRGKSIGGRLYLNKLPVAFTLLLILLIMGGCCTVHKTAATTPKVDQVTRDKAVLERLITELKRSSRSFIYLRSKGFTQTDEEFDQLIAENSAILRHTRIVRRNENGVRQIPGWPGVGLTAEYKQSSADVKQ